MVGGDPGRGSKNLQRLADAGIKLDSLPESTREVLGTLDATELDTIVKIRERLRDVGRIPDPEELAAGVGVFYY